MRVRPGRIPALLPAVLLSALAGCAPGRRAAPEETRGLSRLSTRIRSALEEAIAARIFPGCQCLVFERDRILVEVNLGRLSYAPESPAVGPGTRYDLASLTKCVATASVALVLSASGELPLDVHPDAFLPRLEGPPWKGLALRHLLAHASGLPAWLPLYRNHRGLPDFLETIRALPLTFPPGTRTRYSDLGMILLGACLERAGGRPLEELAASLVFEPLGMTRTRYVRLDDRGLPLLSLDGDVAPTEGRPGGQAFLQGIVHDENARALHGVAGHAGLFSTARDLARWIAALLATAGGAPRGAFTTEAVRLFLRRTDLPPGSSWALGFDTAHEGSSAGPGTPPTAFGHTGFTGTCFWADRRSGLGFVLLTNRVHPSRATKGIGAVRRRVGALCWDYLARRSRTSKAASRASHRGR